MKSFGANRRAKKFLKVLKAMQKDDAELTAPIMQKIKYTLPYNKHCARVRVKGVEEPEVNHPLIIYHRSSIPRFIMSQLEEWGIDIGLDEEADQTYTSVWSIVHFVLGQLAVIKEDTQDSEAYPVVFCWTSAVRQRTIYLFAFVDVAMASRKYTIQELLGFRNIWECQKDGHWTRSIDSLAKNNPDLGKYTLLLIFDLHWCF
jgi:hypothetical protein